MPQAVLAAVRARLAQQFFLATATLAVPLVFASLVRFAAGHWHWTTALHLALALPLWASLLPRTAALRRRRPALVLIACTGVGVSGLVTGGLASPLLPVLLFSPVLAQLLFAWRAGAACAIAVVVLLLLWTLLARSGVNVVATPSSTPPLASGLLYAITSALVLTGTVGGLRGMAEALRTAWAEQRRESRRLEQEDRDVGARLATRITALEVRSEALECTLQLADLGYWSYTPDSSVVQCSARFRELLRLPPAPQPVSLEQLFEALEAPQSSTLQDQLQRCRRHHIPIFLDWHRTTVDAQSPSHLQLAAQSVAPGTRPIIAGYLRDNTPEQALETALHAERQRLTEFIDSSGSGTWEWNLSSGECRFNERWAAILGYTLAELEPTTIDTWMRFGHPEDLKVSSRLLERHFSQELPDYRCECRMRHRAGHWVWVLDQGRVIERQADGSPLRMVGTHTDITAIKDTQLALEQHTLLLEEIGHIARIGGWHYLPGSDTLTWTRQARRLHEVNDNFVPDVASMLDFVHEEERDTLRAALRDCAESGRPWDIEARLVTARGKELTVRYMGQAGRLANGDLQLTGIVQDVSSQKAAREELQRLAQEDALTGAVNRGEFERRLARDIKLAERSAVPLGLAIIDVNGFKRINDEYGHPTGDRVLQWLAQRWAGTVRETDTLARIGGDEFAVTVTSAAGEGDLRRLVARLHECLRDSAEALGLALPVTVSIGVARYPRDARTREALVQAADRAMYVDKRRQRQQQASHAG